MHRAWFDYSMRFMGSIAVSFMHISMTAMGILLISVLPSMAEENTTRAKLHLFFGYSRFNEFEFSPSLGTRLKLPKLSKKALLIIGASNDDDFDADTNPILDNPCNHDNEKSDLSAGLRYFLKVGKRYHFSTTAGVKRESMPGIWRRWNPS